MKEGLTIHTIHARLAGLTACVMAVLTDRGASTQHNNINQKSCTEMLTLFLCTLSGDEKDLKKHVSDVLYTNTARQIQDPGGWL